MADQPVEAFWGILSLSMAWIASLPSFRVARSMWLYVVLDHDDQGHWALAGGPTGPRAWAERHPIRTRSESHGRQLFSVSPIHPTIVHRLALHGVVTNASLGVW